MPSGEAILSGLKAIANDWTIVAMVWHLVILTALASLAFGWRPRHRSVGRLIALLPASVAMFAVAYGNPFNAIVFAALAIALIALSAAEDLHRISRVPGWSVVAGIAMLFLGWTYPHFLDASPIHYLFAAPIGLIPCPTLAAAIGFALVAGEVGRRAWRLALASVGAFYGIYGTVWLGVSIDIVLALGATALAASTFMSSMRARNAGAGAGGASAARAA